MISPISNSPTATDSLQNVVVRPQVVRPVIEPQQPDTVDLSAAARSSNVEGNGNSY